MRGVFTKLVCLVQRSELVSPALRRRLLNAVGAQLNPTAIIEKGCLITPNIVMGPDTLINAYCFVDGSAPLILEEGARIGVRSTIITRDHTIGTGVIRRDMTIPDIVRPVIYRRGSISGAGCTILPGVEIAEGCRIGAGTMMTKSTKPNGLYVNAASPGVDWLPHVVCGRRIKELEVK